MFQSKKTLIISFVFPILVLIGLAGINYFYLKTSEQRLFPISGYDPRSLLSGHYLTFTVDYGLNCPSLEKQEKIQKPMRYKVHVCLEPKKSLEISHKPIKECTLFIKGFCERTFLSWRFNVNNDNRYYVPEQHAKRLEEILMDEDKKREVILSITKKGNVMVKDILIDGKAIKSWIK